MEGPRKNDSRHPASAVGGTLNASGGLCSLEQAVRLDCLELTPSIPPGENVTVELRGSVPTGAGQPAAQIEDAPAPGNLAETNALLRELVGSMRELIVEIRRPRIKARPTAAELKALENSTYDSDSGGFDPVGSSGTELTRLTPPAPAEQPSP